MRVLACVICVHLAKHRPAGLPKLTLRAWLGVTASPLSLQFRRRTVK